MLALERRSRIVHYLEQNGQAEVAELSALFRVAPETIRRDLRGLEEEGALSRTHGGAVSRPSGLAGHRAVEHPVDVRFLENAAEKERICRRAALLVEDGDMIFVDNSSTLIRFVSFIDPGVRATVLTNSLRVLQEAAGSCGENLTLICTGGVFNRANLSLSGTVSGRNAFGLFPSKAFVSCHGLTVEQGFTDGNLLEMGFKREMLAIAARAIFLLDHDKLGRLGPFHLGDLTLCDVLVTDRAPEEGFRDRVREVHPGLEWIVA